MSSVYQKTSFGRRKTLRRYPEDIFVGSSARLLFSRRYLRLCRRHPKDIAKTSYESLLDILQEDLLDVFWNPEDGRHFKTCRRHLFDIFSVSSGFKKTSRRHLKDSQKIRSRYAEYIFSMSSQCILHNFCTVRYVFAR